jgi:2-iminobutanoate/2-iminopropanoate deaminase
MEKRTSVWGGGTVVRPLLVVLAALTATSVLSACAGGGGPHKETIVPGGGPGSPLFSPIVRTGGLYFLSGVIGRSDDGDIGTATRQAMDGIRDRLAAVDATMADVVKCTVFLVDMDDYQPMNEVYVTYFPSDPPARTAVAVRALPVAAQVEVECIAAAR